MSARILVFAFFAFVSAMAKDPPPILKVTQPFQVLTGPGENSTLTITPGQYKFDISFGSSTSLFSLKGDRSNVTFRARTLSRLLPLNDEHPVISAA